MANYCTCWLHIPEKCQKQLEQIIPAYCSFDCRIINTQPRIFEYIFNEVKWGELDFLDEVHKMGIPFIFSNDDSDDPRHITCRFTSDGEMILQDYYESETKIEAHDFIRCINRCETPEAKLKYIHILYMGFSNLLTSLPWDNQVEYGKLYRTRQLIDPS